MAKRRGAEVFAIKFSDLEWPARCPVFGIPLNYSAKQGARDGHALDQLEPGGGYTKNNTSVISMRANQIKNDGTAAEHRRIADWIDSRREELNPITLQERVAMAQAESDMLYAAAAQ